jgi:predicted flap endonuclease-1-like 5' DNA nuclease
MGNADTLSTSLQSDQWVMLTIAILLIGFVLGVILAWLIWGGKVRRLEGKVQLHLDELSLRRSELRNLQEKFDLQEGDLKRATLEVENLKASLQQTASENSNFTTQLSVAQEQIEQLRTTNKASSVTIDDLQNQILGLKTKANQLAAESQFNQAELEGMAQMQSTFNATIDRLKSLEIRIASLVSDNEELRLKIQQNPEPATEVIDLTMPEKDSNFDSLPAAPPHPTPAATEEFRHTDDSLDDLTLINGIGPTSAARLQELGISTFAQISQWDDEKINEVTTHLGIFPGRILRDHWIEQARVLHLLKASSPEVTLLVPPFSTNHEDLKIVEGIGPKIEKVLHDAGIKNWDQLSSTTSDRLAEMLHAAGSQFRMHNPKSWPMQAHFAARGEWKKLKSYQDFLTAGRNLAE